MNPNDPEAETRNQSLIPGGASVPASPDISGMISAARAAATGSTALGGTRSR